jgi:hypothetical protein
MPRVSYRNEQVISPSRRLRDFPVSAEDPSVDESIRRARAFWMASRSDSSGRVNPSEKRHQAAGFRKTLVL